MNSQPITDRRERLSYAGLRNWLEAGFECDAQLQKKRISRKKRKIREYKLAS